MANYIRPETFKQTTTLNSTESKTLLQKAQTLRNQTQKYSFRKKYDQGAQTEKINKLKQGSNWLTLLYNIDKQLPFNSDPNSIIWDEEMLDVKMPSQIIKFNSDQFRSIMIIPERTFINLHQLNYLKNRKQQMFVKLKLTKKYSFQKRKQDLQIIQQLDTQDLQLIDNSLAQKIISSRINPEPPQFLTRNLIAQNIQRNGQKFPSRQQLQSQSQPRAEEPQTQLDNYAEIIIFSATNKLDKSQQLQMMTVESYDSEKERIESFMKKNLQQSDINSFWVNKRKQIAYGSRFKQKRQQKDEQQIDESVVQKKATFNLTRLQNKIWSKF